MARDVFPRTISRGPLVGQRFATKWEYQQARARALGFTGYSRERTAKTNPFFTVAFERARAVRGESRADALRTARGIIGDSGLRKAPKGTFVGTAKGREMSRLIKLLYDEGLYTPGDDVDDRDFYD